MLFLFLQLVFWTFVFEAKVAMIQEEHPPAAKLTLRWMGQITLLKEEDITLLLWIVKQVIDRELVLPICHHRFFFGVCPSSRGKP